MQNLQYTQLQASAAKFQRLSSGPAAINTGALGHLNTPWLPAGHHGYSQHLSETSMTSQLQIIAPNNLKSFLHTILLAPFPPRPPLHLPTPHQRPAVPADTNPETRTASSCTFPLGGILILARDRRRAFGEASRGGGGWEVALRERRLGDVSALLVLRGGEGGRRQENLQVRWKSLDLEGLCINIFISSMPLQIWSDIEDWRCRCSMRISSDILIVYRSLQRAKFVVTHYSNGLIQ